MGTSSTLRHLRPVLNQWQKIVSELSAGWASDRDVPWWYNERAQLSLLAGAVWRAGGACFEEFSGEKRFKNPEKHRLNVLYSGRVDVYFQVGGKEYIAEAKNTWSGYTRNDGRAAKRISDRLVSACDDIGQTAPFGMNRLGIVFVAPYFRSSVKNQIDQRLALWVKEVQSVDADARAWVFPPNARLVRGGDGFYYPGAAIFMKGVVRRRA